MPQLDWHPHNCRERQTLADDRARQAVALRAVVGITRTEAGLLMELVRQGSLCRARYPSPGSVDVHVYNLRRRLAPYDIAIISVHGHGYRLEPEDRTRLIGMIEQACLRPPCRRNAD
jgi:DNA-binding response OmpR family regulator